jgi:hypothetical protein
MLADVVWGRPDFIMADFCVAKAEAPGRRWVCAGLVARVLRRCPGTIAPMNRQESGRGREPHRSQFFAIFAVQSRTERNFAKFTPSTMFGKLLHRVFATRQC